MIQFIGLRLSLVLTSAALPALTSLENRSWASITSVVVAALTGLDTQFQWGDEWRHFRSPQLSLEHARRDYDKRLNEVSFVTARDRSKTRQETFASFYREEKKFSREKRVNSSNSELHLGSVGTHNNPEDLFEYF